LSRIGSIFGSLYDPNIRLSRLKVQDDALSQTDVLDLASGLQQDIAVAALSCGITRTIAFSYGVSVSPVKVPGSALGDQNATDRSINHTDVLDTVRLMAGYTSFQMPNKEGDVLLGWRGNKEPR
jgi:hypothetical protein